MGTCLFRAGPSVPLKGFQMGLWLFHSKRVTPRVLPWLQHRWCHSVSVVMYISHFSGAMFEEHCSKVLIQYDCVTGTIYDVTTFLICIIQQGEYL